MARNSESKGHTPPKPWSAPHNSAFLIRLMWLLSYAQPYYDKLWIIQNWSRVKIVWHTTPNIEYMIVKISQFFQDLSKMRGPPSRQGLGRFRRAEMYGRGRTHPHSRLRFTTLGPDVPERRDIIIWPAKTRGGTVRGPAGELQAAGPLVTTLYIFLTHPK